MRLAIKPIEANGSETRLRGQINSIWVTSEVRRAAALSGADKRGLSSRRRNPSEIDTGALTDSGDFARFHGCVRQHIRIVDRKISE